MNHTPDEMKQAVERMAADLAFCTAHVRLLLSERAELLATVERMRGALTGWAERIDGISWSINTGWLDEIIAEMRRAALTTGEETGEGGT